MIKTGSSRGKRGTEPFSVTDNPEHVPAGRVVFLFSDIEGSTARWEAKRESMQTALRRHDELLHAIVRDRGGHVFKTVGDQFCAAFESAERAVSTAIAIQRGLQEEDFRAVDGILVRIAIHAGVTDERSGDYFGPAVNRVARLLAAGHGGQILLSETIREEIEPMLGDGTSVIDLGWHRLKDIAQPERIFQLCAPGLATDFPPLQSLTVTANNLPQQTTRLIGRESDLAQIAAGLSESRLVSVLGVGGVGKTRVAISAAAAALQHFRDGAWFVNFGPIADPALVTSTIAAALGIKEGAASGAELLAGYCKTRSLLLVFDNCEHVIGEVAAVSAMLLESAPGVKILATSREPLNIAGERTFRLPALDIAGATQLFIERATSADAAFSVAPGDLPVVIEICQRLDGIALAIELAAPRVKLFSIGDLRDALDERFRVLTAGTRTAPARQKTMRALIEWSYELLGEEERSLFRRLGTFAGPFSLAGAQAVCADADLCDVLDVLSALVDKSLVVAGGASRFSLLQSLRAFALERLDDAGESERYFRRFAEYVCAFGERLYERWDAGEDAAWIAAAQTELDNVRAGLTWTLGEGNEKESGAALVAHVAPLFVRLSLLSEAISWCKKALDARPPDQTAARLYFSLATSYNNQGASAAALEAATAAVRHSRSCADARMLARSLAQYAWRLRQEDRYDEAAAASAEAIETARKLADRKLLATILVRCALALPPEHIESAREQFAEAVATFHSTKQETERARALAWWAIAEGAAGCFERAIDLASQSLDADVADVKLYVQFNLAGYALSLDDFKLAREHAAATLMASKELQHSVIFALSASYLAIAALESDPTASARVFGYAKAQFPQNDWPPEAHVNPEIYRRYDEKLREAVDPGALQSWFDEGAAWDAERAFSSALAL